MKIIRIISLIARTAFVVTMLLGLLYWVTQLFTLTMILNILAQLHFTALHEGLGIIGVLALLVLGGVAVSTKGIRLLGVGSIIYALLLPVFGLTQVYILEGPLHWLIQVAHLLVGIGAMMLALNINKRYGRLNLKEQGVTNVQPQGLIGRMAIMVSNTSKEQATTGIQPQGRPYPPFVIRLARMAVSAHVAFYRLSGGKIGGRAQHMPILLLTTTGRKSGKEHTTALVYMPDGKDFIVVGSNGGQGRLPNWWLNMRKSKQARIEVGRKCFHVSAQEASGEERQRLWSRIIAYHAGHEAYQERTPYPLPIVILHPAAVV